jgi:hypothetical protein
MTTFTIIKNAKEEAGQFAGFWEVDKPIFKNEKFGITEQWSIEQRYGFKPEGSFSLVGAK